jgi:SAM-dependent methyltransferase
MGRADSSGTSEQWRQYGEIDPYYGVFPEPRFRTDALDARTYDEFFESGRRSVARLLALLEQHLPDDRPLQWVLDFGCGPGRSALAFAETAEQVLAVDVAPAMLEETRRNAARAGLTNIRTRLTDELSDADDEFDLVHSESVLQHIRPRVGYPLIVSLVRRLRPGGAVALHVTTRPFSRIGRLYFMTVRHAPFLARIWNVARRRPFGYPLMEMHAYDLGRMVRLLASEGIEVSVVRPVIATGRTDYHGAWLLGRRGATSYA